MEAKYESALKRVSISQHMLFEQIVEPLNQLFKDEVREAGLMLGIPPELVFRQPFPGPGMAVRILGEITEEKVKLLQEADAMQKSGGIKKDYEYADLALVPFMASMTNRPITVYTLHGGQVNKSFYTKDILTGKPLTGEPMAVIYNQDGKHFEATERLAN